MLKKLSKKNILKRVNFEFVKYIQDSKLLDTLSKALSSVKKHRANEYGIIFDTNIIVHDITYVPVFPDKYDILCLESELDSYKKSDDKSLYWIPTNILSSGNFIINGSSIDKVLEIIKSSKDITEFYKNLNKLDIYTVTQIHFSEREKHYIHDPLVINKTLRYQEQLDFSSSVKSFIENEKYQDEKSKELFKIALSIGVSAFGMYCEDRNINSLVKLAHFTMLKGKDLNQSLLVTNDEIRLIKQDLDSFNQEIESGFKLDEFSPYFLPIIDTTTLRIIGCESLVRWRKNKYRIIEASKFKDIAIEKNLFQKIDKRVIEKTFSAYKNWLANGLIDKNFTITINLSLQSLLDLDIQEVVGLAHQNNVLIGNVEFDISDEIQLTAETEEAIIKLTKYGFMVSIDAFGQKSFIVQSYSKLPITTLKLDRVNLPPSKPTDSEYKIYETLVNLTRIMNYKVLTKGIENKFQLNLAKQLNVDYVQGYYFTPPLDESRIEIFLSKYRNGIPV